MSEFDQDNYAAKGRKTSEFAKDTGAVKGRRMIEIKGEEERVVLVAVDLGKYSVEESLDELEELAKTAGAEVLSRMVQPRDEVHPGTYVGAGKLDEIKAVVETLGATGIICDDELSPAQLKNLEQALDTKVMDRTLVILDIFAKHARSREGRIQVELAQLRYRAVRLVGLRDSLSRLGGGIGTRGPGETKLETDRRVIHERISRLRRELAEIERHRDVTRRQRERNGIPEVAIVGYTNAGKSTLLNTLTGSDILAENKLFATLDPTTRVLKLPGDQEVLLTDTVGFIRKLPHNLVEAFRSTLEEATHADVIVLVVDASSPAKESHMATVYETLRELGAANKTIITVFNKTDLLPSPRLVLRDPEAYDSLEISAKNGRGLDELRIVLSNVLRARRVFIECTFDYCDAGKIARIRKAGQLLSEEYTEEGIHITAYIPMELEGMLR